MNDLRWGGRVEGVGGDHRALISISRSMITSTRRIDAQMPLLESVEDKGSCYLSLEVSRSHRSRQLA